MLNAELPKWMPEGGRGLFTIVRSLSGPMMVERSAKWMGEKLWQDRFLLSIPKSSLYPGPIGQLEEISSSFGVPSEGLVKMLALLPKASNIHFGFEPEADGDRLKIYLEFVSENSPDKDLIFWALKWVASGEAKSSVISRYWSRRGMTNLEKINLIQSILPTGPELDTMLFIFNILTTSKSESTLLEVEEPGNPRRSLDVNLSNVGCLIGDLKNVLPKGLSVFCRENEKIPVGHISTGIARNGKPFLTLYYGAEMLS